jgi:exodeoxyribonuclease V alpha subunit
MNGKGYLTGTIPESIVDNVYQEIAGEVSSLIKSPKQSGPYQQTDEIRFYVKLHNTDTTVPCHCAFFTIVHEGDRIHLIGSKVDDTTNIYKGSHTFYIKVERPPLVIIGDSATIIKSIFAKVVPMIVERAQQLYAKLFTICVDQNLSVSEYMDKIVQCWIDTRDITLFDEFSSHIRGEDKIKKLFKWWYKNRILRKLYTFGLTNKDIKNCELPVNKIYQHCLSNPYKLIALSMEKCDEILLIQGRKLDRCIRNASLIVRNINSVLRNNSWTYLPPWSFMEVLCKYDEVRDNLPLYIDILKDEYGLIEDLSLGLLNQEKEKEDKEKEDKEKVREKEKGREVRGNIYLPYQYLVENTICARLRDIVKSENRQCIMKDNTFFYEKNLTDEQKQAIISACSNPISIITGGGGTGKTTLLKELVKQMEVNEIPYKIASFTGKAVARIREVLGARKASTIHRMLTVMKDDVQEFRYFIIDEASMVTSDLFYQVLDQWRWEYRIVLIGDCNQLPPIGSGALFDQIIKSGIAPVMYLTINHRSNLGAGQQNGIIANAQKLLNHRADQHFYFDLYDNFQIYEGEQVPVEHIVSYLKNTKQSTCTDVTIITPYNDVMPRLNYRCQMIFNGNNECCSDFRGIQWRIGDRVMMLKNNDSINVMNGEEGLIIKIDQIDRKIVVEFKDGNIQHFKLFPDLNRQPNDDEETEEQLTVDLLQHSYCITVHKSQGSEYDYIIFYVPPNRSGGSFLDRNLVYTAITRAKKAVWIVGGINEMFSCVSKEKRAVFDSLSKRLRLTIFGEE